MNFLNSDFAGSSKGVDQFREFYLSQPSSMVSDSEKMPSGQPIEDDSKLYGKAAPLATLFWNTAVLSERTALNYLRNLLAYGVRIGMYGGMGLMLA